jgi:hypothetical protein
MKRIILILLAASFAGSADAVAADWHWWGLVSFRQRYEESREYIDFTISDTSQWGNIRFTEQNSRTRLGYQFGFKTEVKDNLHLGVTMRSGLGSVMWQDINNSNGLMPGVQEAYLDWDTPYLELLAGKIPQNGTPMWDLYAAPLWIDFRQDDPTDGVYNDRISALSGARVQVPAGVLTLRGTYHTDYVGGGQRHWHESSQEDEITLQLDQKVFLLGGAIDISALVGDHLPGALSGLKMTLDGDYGQAYRAGYFQHAGKDSLYADENLWGLNLNAGLPHLDLTAGYGYNWRDSVFKSDFLDMTLAGEVAGFRLTGRWQHNRQEHETGIYKGHDAVRNAYHVYFNKTVWNLDLQPRYIYFVTEVDDRKTKSTERMELTATVRF